MHEFTHSSHNMHTSTLPHLVEQDDISKLNLVQQQLCHVAVILLISLLAPLTQALHTGAAGGEGGGAGRAGQGRAGQGDASLRP